MTVPCSMVHGNQSCAGHCISFLLQAYGRALPVYLPVYLIPALIVHRQDLLERPYTILTKGLLGTARSSLFLSVYCTSAWMWTCLLFRIFKRCNIPMVAMGAFPPGLALLIEKKSRRIEISLYCIARAIESFFTCMSFAGNLPQQKRLKRADVVVFSISTAIIMHCYAQEREVFRSKYLNVLDWVFGVPPPCNKNVWGSRHFSSSNFLRGKKKDKIFIFARDLVCKCFSDAVIQGQFAAGLDLDCLLLGAYFGCRRVSDESCKYRWSDEKSIKIQDGCCLSFSRIQHIRKGPNFWTCSKHAWIFLFCFSFYIGM